MDTHPTVDKILCTDRILSIYPLICGQTCHAWTVDTKKCAVEQNYLLICGHLAISSGGCHGTFNEIGLRWPQFIHKEGKDQREKCEPHIWRRICDIINECEKTFEKVQKLICTVWIIEASHMWTLCQPWTLDGVQWIVRVWQVLLYYKSRPQSLGKSK